LPAPDPQAARREKKRAGLAEICEMAARFFQHEYRAPRGEAARAYCAKRGLAVARPSGIPFRLRTRQPGCAEALIWRARRSGSMTMIEAGLVIRPEDGRPVL
jgi:DNA primase